MRVLIVDDEVKVCNLIRNLVDWQALGLEIVGVANDGESAFRMVQELSPEIVITDIRMPGYSGIEFIQKVRENNDAMHFIIVSGYRQFEYANQAIKFGVEDYLLKPLKKAEVEKILTKIVRRHHENLARTQKQEDIENRMTQSAVQIRDYFMQLVLDEKRWAERNLTLPAANETYHLRLQKQGFRVLLIWALVRRNPLEASANSALLKKIRYILETHLEQEVSEAVVGIGDGFLACLVNDSPERLESLRAAVGRLLGGLSALKDIFGPFDITIALSGVARRFEDLPVCVREARAASLQRIFLPGETIIEYSPAFLPAVDATEVFDNRFRLRFRAKLTTLENRSICEGFEEAYALLRECAPSGLLVALGMDRLMEIFLDTMGENGVLLSSGFREECRKRLRAACSLREAFEDLEEFCLAELHAWKAKKNEEILRPIRKAKSYIQEHYEKPLTLNSVSAEIGLSPSYFSTVFKRETGRNFVDYLTEVRIDAAKEFLVRTDLGIGEIAEKVGYNDMKYFYKRFKQAVGVSLKEYRKLYY